jgi:two-component system, response regulator
MKPGIILLVEDNDDDITLTKRAFKKHKFPHELVVVRDGVEALDFLFATGTFADRDAKIQPDMILLDLKLPRIDGHEVLKKIRSDPRTALLRVVVLTSSKEDQDILQSYSLGANSYIRKPVDYDQFVEAVGQLGLYWLLLNETPPHPKPVAP